ncbi:MAG TPA: hypothetical protein VGW36_03915 [Pyrinomonadaceae bacterium]|nr:hypothetical protein [Pyrinomonadaceae bacterium]
MRRVARRVRIIAAAICVLVCLASTASVVAQRRRAARRPAARPTRPVRATTPAPPPTTAREPELQLERLPPDPDVENADIAITANVKARSLLFEVVPNPTVEFPGKPARNTIWEAKRENLPTPVEPGVTYRNIGIRLKITSVFSDIDRIVAEALGEVPMTDDKPAGNAKQPSTTSKAGSPGSAPPASAPPQRERR